MKLFLLAALLGGAWAGLPKDCVPAQTAAFDIFNPATAFGSADDIRVYPRRTGKLRSNGPIPTGHFATNHLKSDLIWPMILTPYQSLMTSEGAVHEVYTMNRWSDPNRTDFMEQQSAWEQGKPWNKLNDMGTNMKQMTSGPEGNPLSEFTGQSGIQVSIDGAGEPELTSFGELYANFLYRGSNKGSMEIPLVRGASLMTHILTSANPVLKPYCLSTIDEKDAVFACPLERKGADGGDGYVRATCTGRTMTMYFHNSKPVDALDKVEWAAEPASSWPIMKRMRRCTDVTCSLEDGGKTVKINVPFAQGLMYYAINYIGYYTVPVNWMIKPDNVTCKSKRDIENIAMSATCDASGDLTIVVDLAGVDSPKIKQFQYAVGPAAAWTPNRWWYNPRMNDCDATECKMEGNTLVIRTKISYPDYKLALNMIGHRTFPAAEWKESPYAGKCDGSSITDGISRGGGPVRPGSGSNPDINNELKPGKKFILEMDEPGRDFAGFTRKFILYFTSIVVPKVDLIAQTITFEPSGGGRYNGLLQIGYVGSSAKGDESKNSFLDDYTGVYPYRPSVFYCVSESAGKGYLEFQWNTVATSGYSIRTRKPLMIGMPHHDLLLKIPSKDTPFTFKGYVDNEWIMELDILYTGVDPDPKGVRKVMANPSQRQDIINAINTDAPNQNLDAECTDSNSYGAGKGIGMVTRLASLSRAFGTQHYLRLEESIKNCLEKWLRVQDVLADKKKLRYDTVWGGLYARGSDDDVVPWDTDFGFPFYSDHHFHLGYFIYAAAYYVKHHPKWGNDHKSRIYALARDVGNPSIKDTYFPVSRQKDIYTGFSWATGLVPGTRQEESASEGINCYHGLAALGDAFNDANMKQTGQILLSMEIHSVREYWQVRSHNKDHFPPILQKNGVVGMVTEPDFYAYTLNWPCDPNIFPQRHGCIVGIQVIPITSVSKYWVDKEWASSIRQNCEYAISPATNPLYHKAEMTPQLAKQLYPGWKAFCHAAMAPLDAAHAKAAADYVKQRIPQQLVPGTGTASTLMFIYGST